ncbi:MAG: transglutaminase-like domain-containing protein [Thermoanaerobaculia bacterium]|nr:transglutaminase-like domain-containing protein [Thermoanaerobaculia bacterium]
MVRETTPLHPVVSSETSWTAMRLIRFAAMRVAIGWLGLLTTWALVQPATGAAHAEQVERYYRMELGGQPAGWVVETTTVSEGLWVTETHTRMELRRAGTATSMEMFSRFEETAEHQPVSGMTRQALGSAPLVTTFRFDDETVQVQEPGGATRRHDLGKRTWMTPVETSEHVIRQIRRAYDEPGSTDFAFEVRRLELLVGVEPVTGRYVLQDPDDPIEIDGRRRETGRWAMSESYAPLLTTLAWIDRDGVLLRSEADMMGMKMVMSLTDDDPRDDLASDEERSAQLPELLVQTFVRPDRPIEASRDLRRGVFRLQVQDLDVASLRQVVPTAGVQHVRPDGTRDALLVEVDLDRQIGESVLEDREIFLRPTRYLDFEHDAVQRLIESWRRSTRPVEPPGDAAGRSEALRRFVGRHLSDKNLGTVLGSASDTATNGSGDCTEHAVLLAALLRAEGIPSRVAVGLVYAEEFAGENDLFAYHMWTQAWLGVEGGSSWVDLDATLPDATPFDATHILFATSPLAEEGVPLLGTGVEAIFGRLSIEVVSPGPANPRS